jgi:hypothetical protein
MLNNRFNQLQLNNTQGSSNALNDYVAPLNPLVWFDASTGFSDDGSLMTWTSKVNNYALFASGSARPSYSTAVSALGNKPGFTFNGSTWFQDVNTSMASLLTGSQTYTSYYVARLTALGAARAAWAAGSQAISFFVSHGFQGLNVQFLARTGTNTTGSIATNTTTTFIAAITYSGTAYNSWFNGVQSINNITNATSIGADRFTIGCRLAGAPGQYFSGSIGEVIIFRGNHDTATRQTIERLLANKYNVTLT